MKRFSVIIIFLAVSLSFWAYSYKVNVTSTLNLRSQPSTSSEIVHKLENGDIVECHVNLETSEEHFDWVKVSYKGKSGFLKAEYLTLVKGLTTENENTTRAKQWHELLDWEGDGYKWMVYLIFGLTLIMWFESKFIRQLTTSFKCEGSRPSKKMAWINAVLLTITSCSILFYVIKMGINSLWLFMPTVVNSWWFVVINFIIFVYVLINLLVFFILTINDIAETAGISINFKFGLFTWLAGIISLVICGIGNYNPEYVYVFIAICQTIQIGIILFQLGSKKRYLTAITLSIIYVLGSVSIVILASCLVFVLMVLAILAIVLLVVIRLNTAPGGMLSDKDGIPNPNGSLTADGDYTIINTEGQKTRLTHSDGQIYSGSDGHTYQRTGDSFNRI